MSVAEEIEQRLSALADADKAAVLSRFFKTGKGEYGEGDVFLGIPVPITRTVVKEYRKSVELHDIDRLTQSPAHETRLAGFLLLIEYYKRSSAPAWRRDAVAYYISILHRGNNWDLVDLVAPKILGDWLLSHTRERKILHELAAMDGHLWHQRTGMVACWTLIHEGEFADALQIAERLIPHTHDLIHKASGWMLREIGKRGGLAELYDFLDANAARMPRTMLRYSIEKLPPEERDHYMKL